VGGQRLGAGRRAAPGAGAARTARRQAAQLAAPAAAAQVPASVTDGLAASAERNAAPRPASAATTPARLASSSRLRARARALRSRWRTRPGERRQGHEQRARASWLFAKCAVCQAELALIGNLQGVLCRRARGAPPAPAPAAVDRGHADDGAGRVDGGRRERDQQLLAARAHARQRQDVRRVVPARPRGLLSQLG